MFFLQDPRDLSQGIEPGPMAVKVPNLSLDHQETPRGPLFGPTEETGFGEGVGGETAMRRIQRGHWKDNLVSLGFESQ